VVRRRLLDDELSGLEMGEKVELKSAIVVMGVGSPVVSSVGGDGELGAEPSMFEVLSGDGEGDLDRGGVGEGEGERELSLDPNA
jgi:hypothetical protein